MLRAEEIIDLRNRELSQQGNIRSLWQETADKLYPYVNITTTYADGEARTEEIYDITPMLDAEDMVSGLKQVLLTAGQNIFAIKVKSDKEQSDVVQRYISTLTEEAHNQIFNSNFVTEFDEVLRSLIIFGPASMYSDWTPNTGLNYLACVIGTYQFLENAKKLVDGIILTVSYTPRQAIEEFGEEVGDDIIKASQEPKKSNDKFEFIYLIQPRKVTSRNRPDSATNNMKWEQVVVNVKEKKIVYEAGYQQFPYHSARWKRPAEEKHGRGIGTEILPQIKVLERMNRDFIEVGNKSANPPRQVHESVEGTVRVFPGATNVVREMDTIRPLDIGLNGNFIITEKSLERQTAIIDRAFFKNAFSPLEDLTGDRRTTLEIRERIRQTWHKIGPPVARIWYELMSGLIERSIMLLIRNGVVPPPPQELQGTGFNLEFVSPFALELRSQQAKAFQEWATFVGQMEAVFPGSVDNVDADDAIQRMGRSFGVNVEDMASAEEREAKRQARAQAQQQQMAMEAAKVAGDAYGKATGAPEEGSAAGMLMNG